MARRLLTSSIQWIVAAASLSAPVAAMQPDCSDSRSAQISSSVDIAVRELNGLSGRVLVVHCKKTLVDRPLGFSDRERKIPIASDTKFDFGSLTKQFVAAAILRLSDQGKL